MRPIRKGRLASQVVEALCEYMVERGLQPNDRLPSERDLAEALTVSRTVVREALRILEERGLVSVNHGKETHILAIPERPGGALVEHGTVFERTEIEARATFEAGLAAVIVRQATEDDVCRLEGIAEEMCRLVRLGQSANRLDIAFHEHLLDCTHNPLLVDAGRSLVLVPLQAWVMRIPIHSHLEAPEEVHPEEHAAIAARLRARDVQGLGQLLQIHPYPQDAPERVMSRPFQ